MEEATAVWRSWELISGESMGLLESWIFHINSKFKSIAARHLNQTANPSRRSPSLIWRDCRAEYQMSRYYLEAENPLKCPPIGTDWSACMSPTNRSRHSKGSRLSTTYKDIIVATTRSFSWVSLDVFSPLFLLRGHSRRSTVPKAGKTVPHVGLRPDRGSIRWLLHMWYHRQKRRMEVSRFQRYFPADLVSGPYVRPPDGLVQADHWRGAIRGRDRPRNYGWRSIRR